MTRSNPPVEGVGVRSESERTVALSMERLVKRFKRVTAVDHVSIDVERGEFLTLLGPSGSGKTTILRMIAGFEEPTSGRILLEGEDISVLSPSERGIGVVFQQYALFPHMTVAQNVAYPLRMRRWPASRRSERVAQMLALVRLEDLGNRYPSQLSGGQQQRIALARALSFDPALLLMDEPLGALDRALRLGMQEEIRRIHRELGATIVYVTHDQDEALGLSDRIAVLRQGRLLQIGSPNTLFERPANEFIATFFEDCTLIPATAVARTRSGFAEVEALGTRFEARSSESGDLGDVRLVIRPQSLSLDERDGDMAIPALVRDVMYSGDISRVTCDNEDIGRIVLKVQPERAREVTIGQHIEVFFAPFDSVAVAPSSH